MSTVRNCPSCAAKNRVSSDHLADAGRCGRCHAALPPVDEPLDVDERTFTELVGAAKVPVLVDFWAPWCGPCKMAAPEVHKAAQQLAGRAIVVKVNTDANPQLAARYGVRGIPMFAVVHAGQVVQQQTGLVDARRLVGMVPSR